MPVLKSLAFAAMPKRANDPISVRRARLIDRLEEQLKLIQDPAYVRTIQRWAKVDGEKRLVSKDQRIAPWWRTDAAGHLFMSVKFAGRPIEFDKGKAAIAVPSQDKLPAVIDTLITAVRGGELDDILSQASKQRVLVKAKKAA